MVIFARLAGWGLRRQMRKQETSAAAYQSALPRVHEDPKLALAILAGNYTRTEKLAVLEKVRSTLPYAAIETAQPFHTLTELRTLPPFFKLLAKQKRAAIDNVWRLWTDNGKSNVKTHDFSAAAAARLGSKYVYIGGETLAVTADSFQSVIRFVAEGQGGQSHYFATGCEIEGLFFAYRFRA